MKLLTLKVALVLLVLPISTALFDAPKTLGDLILKDLYEYVKSYFATTWSAVKIVRDPPHHKCIVNREKELKELKELFDGFPNHDNTVNGVYLLGVPGSGKTELARQYGNFANEKHGVSTVITLNAEGSDVFRKNLFNALKEIKTPKLTIEQIDLMQRWKLSDLMNELRRLLQKRRGWLLIVDNIRDPNITQKELYKELPRPGTDKWGTGMMLVTTQVPLHHRNSTHVRIKNTNDGLTPDDATNFLCGLVTRNESSRVCDKKVATDIVIKLERLPLSIFAAGIYVDSSMSMKSDGSYSIDNYLEELKSLGIPHAQNLTPSHSDYRHSMLAALQLTIDQTIKVNSEELPADVFLDFIALIGYTAGEVEGTISSLHLEKYIEMRGHDPKYFPMLRNFPLVDFWEEKKRFRAHEIVRYAFRSALERSEMDLLPYTIGNILHFFATVYKSDPNDLEIVKMFQHLIESLPDPYCHQNLCIIPLGKNADDLISLFLRRFAYEFDFKAFIRLSAQTSSLSLSVVCPILDIFLIRLDNIRLDNPNSVSPPMIFKGYQYLYLCYKGQHEKQSMVATRAIDVIREIAPERSELHTIAASTFLLERSHVLHSLPYCKWLKNKVFRSLLCSKTIKKMYFRDRDIRRVVDYFKKLCLSLSEFYKELIPVYASPDRMETMRRTLISISEMASTEVHIECVATMSRCFTFHYEDKVIHDKKLPNEHHIGLGRRYQLGQYGIRQSYVGENRYGACSSKQVYTVKDFGPSLIFYIDYDIRIGLKNTEFVFDKYFEVFNYYIPMLRKLILHRLIFRQKNRKPQKISYPFMAFFRHTLNETHKEQRFIWEFSKGVMETKSIYDYLACTDVDPARENINPQTMIDSIHQHVYFDGIAFSLRKLLCYQRPEEATEILLEIFDAIVYALWPTTELMPDLKL